MVKEPLQSHQISKGDNLTKKETSVWATTSVIILTHSKQFMHQKRANTLVAIDLIDHDTCLESKYPRNKASVLSHTHLNTLNRDHFIMEVLFNPATAVIYSTNLSGVGGGGLSVFLCLLDLISHTVVLYLTLLMRDNSCKYYVYS